MSGLGITLTAITRATQGAINGMRETNADNKLAYSTDGAPPSGPGYGVGGGYDTNADHYATWE